MVIAELAQVPEPALGRENVSALAQPRLDHDRRHLRGGDHPLEENLVYVVEVAVEGVVDGGEHRTEVGSVFRLARG